MISLLLIPTLLIPLLNKEFKYRDKRLLKLNIPSPTYNKSKPSIEYNYSLLDEIRKDVKFNSFEPEKLSKNELESVFKEFKKNQTNKDFLKSKPINFQFGIKAILSQNMNYDTFVNLINLCVKYNIYTWGFDFRYDEMYIYATVNNPPVNYIDSNFFGNCIQVIPIQKTNIDIFKEQIDYYFLPFYDESEKVKLILILYVIFVIFSIWTNRGLQIRKSF